MKELQPFNDSVESTLAAIKAAGNELQKMGEEFNQSVEKLNQALSQKAVLPDFKEASKLGEDISQQMEKMNQYLSETMALFSQENMQAHLRRSMQAYNKPVFRPNE